MVIHLGYMNKNNKKIVQCVLFGFKTQKSHTNNKNSSIVLFYILTGSLIIY